MYRLALIACFALVACDDTSAPVCPGPPKDVTVETLAPVFGGLAKLTFKPTNRAVSYYVERFNPVLQLWEPALASSFTADDDSIIFAVQLPTGYRAEDEAVVKLRILADRENCVPSEWNELEPIALASPLADKTFEASQAGELGGALSYFDTGGLAQLTVNAFTHTMTFAADGTVHQRFRFTLQNAVEGGVYDNCTIDHGYTGTWKLEGSIYSQSIAVGPASAIPAENRSTCASPEASTFAFSAAATPPVLNGVTLPIVFDYFGLLQVPPLPISFIAGGAAMSDIFEHLVPDGTSAQMSAFATHNGKYTLQVSE